MTFVALALAAALMVTVLAGAQLLRSQQRDHARRLDLVLNQLLHATGNTWTPPPAEPAEEPVERDLTVRFTARPEQFPN